MYALQPTRSVGGIIVAFLRRAQIDTRGVEDIHPQPSSATPAACVIAVDDQPCFRTVLREVVGATSELIVVGEAESGEAAVDLVLDVEPDMVLMDVRMPGIGGIEATRRIKALRPSTIVVLVSTTHPDALRSSDEPLGDEFVWKNELRPKLLDDIWRRHGGARRPAPAPA
jgi:two-component system invasion response regulator UvrY